MKVIAKNAQLAGILKHPSGVGFLDKDTPSDWPDDQFTTRRIQDGDITVHKEPVKTAPLKVEAQAETVKKT